MTVITPIIPQKQKAAIYDKPGTVSTKVVELDVPEPGPGEVLINLTHSGVCHSDFGVMTNSWSPLPLPTQPGQVGGHEGVGKIVKLGPNSESSGLKIGDRVGIKWVSAVCGNCQPCQNNAEGLCHQGRVSGYYTPGTFQQYALGPANYVSRIPDEVPSEQAAPILCAGLTVYSALKRSEARPGQWVVISGAGGGLGHLGVQIASRGMGLRVIGIDHGSKADLVMESGAEHFVDITQFGPGGANGGADGAGADGAGADGAGAGAAVNGEGAKYKEKDIAKYVKSLTPDGLGAHAVIVCTASNAAYAQAVGFLRFNGALVCVGVPEHAPKPIATACPWALIVGNLKIMGSAVGTRAEAIEALDFVARGVVRSHIRMEKMDKLTDVFREMDEGKMQGRVVLDLT